MKPASTEQVKDTIYDYLSQDMSRRYLDRDEIARAVLDHLHTQGITADHVVIKREIEEALEVRIPNWFFRSFGGVYVVFELLTYFQVLDFASYVTGGLRFLLLGFYSYAGIKLHFKSFKRN